MLTDGAVISLLRVYLFKEFLSGQDCYGAVLEVLFVARHNAVSLLVDS